MDKPTTWVQQIRWMLGLWLASVLTSMALAYGVRALLVWYGG